MLYRFIAIIFVASLVGCGGGEKTRPTVEIEGTVTLDADPIEQGSITFDPKDGKGGATSANIVDGIYKVKIEPGIKIVRIYYPKVVGVEKIYPSSVDSPTHEIKKEQVPAQYNSASTLEKDLTSVTESVDFNLKTK